LCQASFMEMKLLTVTPQNNLSSETGA